MRVLVAVAAVAVVIIAYYAGGMLGSKTVVVYNNTGSVVYLMSENNISSASVVLPAVDESGNGVGTELLVQLASGSGRILVNIDRMVYWSDTQDSIRTARDVAQSHLRANLSSYDVIYTIRANASTVEGPSAGAALAVATIAAYEGRTPNASVMMTGAINPDGTLARIGDVASKAKAAKDIGALLFVVPEGQSVEYVDSVAERCRPFGASQICAIENVQSTINVSESAGIAVAEAKNIGEALGYFLS